MNVGGYPEHHCGQQNAVLPATSSHPLRESNMRVVPSQDDLYNLTQLAEVSLAAAAGHIFRPTPSKFEVRISEVILN